MAITISEFMTIFGKILKSANYYQSTFATMVSNREALVQELADIDADHLVDGLTSAVSSHISGLSAGCSFFQSKANELLLDPEFTSQFALTQINLPNVLNALRNASGMVDAFESSFTTVGTIVKSNNTGQTADLIYSVYLDQVSVPVIGGIALNYNQTSPVPSELGVVGNVYMKCTSAPSEGTEQFTLFGSTSVPPFQEEAETVSGSVSISAGDAQNLLSNAQFETYSAGFTGWTIVDAGGTLSQETSLMYRGASAAKIVTLANADTVTFEQTLGQALTPGKAYFVGFRYKSIAAEAGGNIAVNLYLGDGTLTANALTANFPITSTNWGLAYGLVVYPYDADVNENTEVTLEFSPTVDNVDGIVIDDAFVIPATYFNGLAWAHVNGTIRTRTNDLWTAPVVRSNVGIMQEGFRKFWGVQMPSIDDTTETYADTLAT